MDTSKFSSVEFDAARSDGNAELLMAFKIALWSWLAALIVLSLLLLYGTDVNDDSSQFGLLFLAASLVGIFWPLFYVFKALKAKKLRAEIEWEFYLKVADRDA